MRPVTGLTTSFVLLTFLSLLSVDDIANASSLETQQQALNIIADFAERLCTTVPLIGSASNLELSGDAKAKLSELIKKIADLGIEGAAKYQTSAWEGVLQQDLAEQLNTSRNCKIEVFKDLKDKLLISVAGEVKSVQLGDVTLVVGRVKAPVFWLFNAGPARADRPKYQFLLYNLNQDDTDQPRRILHIPVKLFEDYILSEHALGPWKILDLSNRAKEVELGHTVFGYVTVQCANCRTVRYYWIFLKVGSAGWTLEVPESESDRLNRMLAKVIYTGEQAISTVDSVIPMEGRKPIE